MVIPILKRKSVRSKDCNVQNLVNGGVRILSTGGLTFLISKGLYLSGWAKLYYSSNDCHIAVGQYKVNLFLAHAASPAQDSRRALFLIFTHGSKLRESPS